VAEDVPIKTALGAHREEAIDPEVAEITNEKQSVSYGFDDTGDVQIRASDDVDEGE
jgi:hypothetical protein